MKANRILWIEASSAAPPDRKPAACVVDRASPETFGQCLRATAYDAVVLDLPIPGWTAASLLQEVQRVASRVPVLIHDPFADIEAAIEERRRGDSSRLAERVEREDWERLLVGDSHAMRQVGHIIHMVGSRRATVLITGETGTGKEVAARALHLAGPRRRGPMVAVNCCALPENLLEAELFGHVRGAFTGATQNRVGRFEQAEGGTLFLDEIGELPMELQAKLLRVLQEREFQRLGSSESVRVDVRVVAATNRDLLEKIASGQFREDLYYRLNVVPLRMPPLRERAGDIPMLAGHFVEKICRLESLPVKSLTAESLERLCRYSWPGNVRQLENAVEMAVALSGDRPVLTPADFPLPAPARASTSMRLDSPVVAVPDSGLDYEETMALIERSILEQALRKTGGNKKAAAEMLRLKRTTLSAKVRNFEPAAACN